MCLAIKRASRKREIKRNNFSLYTENKREIIPCPGFSCHLHQSTLSTSVNMYFAHWQWDSMTCKTTTHLQLRQHRFKPPTSRKCLYFIDKEPEVQNREKTCLRHVISKWAVIQRWDIQMSKFNHCTFLPLSSCSLGILDTNLSSVTLDNIQWVHVFPSLINIEGIDLESLIGVLKTSNNW